MTTNQKIKDLVNHIKTNYPNGCDGVECETCIIFNLKPENIVENHVCSILRHLDSK